MYFSKTPFLIVVSGFTQSAFRAVNSSSEILRLMVFLTASMVIISPFLTNAIPPPSYASGVM